ncbi:MAG TPA: lipopolysaccharide biosynthesis protein [Blastocatellia bacterium]|nr:lipopolysaccharide biosynthesis protein [Blastocatellia bacterium]
MSTDNSGSGKSVLTRRAALLAAAKIVGYALTLPLPLVLVRLLSQSDFGLYKQAFQLVMTLVALLGLQISVSVYYFMPRHPDKKPQVVMNVMIFYAVVAGAAALVFAVYPRCITPIYKTDDLVGLLPFIGLAIWLWLMSSLLEVVTIADGDVRSASAFTVLLQLTKSALLIAAALIFRNVQAIVIFASIQGALACGILFLYLKKRYGHFWRSFDYALFKAQLGNALPFGLGALAFGAQADLHNYFVSHYFEPALFAIYSVGCFDIPLLGMLYESVVSVLLPEVARLRVEGDNEGIVSLWATAIRKLAFCYVPTYALLFVMREEIITFLFTKQYKESAIIFAINLLLLPMYLSVYTSFLRAFDDLRFFRLKLSVVMIPLTCGLLYAGIHMAGLTGAVSACVLAQMIDVSIMVTKIARRLGLAPREIRRLAPVLRTLAASAIAGVAAYAVKIALADAHVIFTLTACVSAFGVVFSFAAFAVGAVTDDEKSELMRFYRSGTRRLGFSSATEAQ